MKVPPTAGALRFTGPIVAIMHSAIDPVAVGRAISLYLATRTRLKDIDCIQVQLRAPAALCANT